MPNLPNFDELAKLAKTNPEALEVLRQQYVNRLIGNAPEACRQRLRGLQFQIDAHRKIHSKSPLGSCMKITQMMHESFVELRGWLNQISGNDPLREIAKAATPTQIKVADILAFPSN